MTSSVGPAGTLDVGVADAVREAVAVAGPVLPVVREGLLLHPDKATATAAADTMSRRTDRSSRRLRDFGASQSYVSLPRLDVPCTDRLRGAEWGPEPAFRLLGGFHEPPGDSQVSDRARTASAGVPGEPTLARLPGDGSRRGQPISPPGSHPTCRPASADRGRVRCVDLHDEGLAGAGSALVASSGADPTAQVGVAAGPARAQRPSTGEQQRPGGGAGAAVDLARTGQGLDPGRGLGGLLRERSRHPAGHLDLPPAVVRAGRARRSSASARLRTRRRRSR
jgi:hypothetical protein